MSVCKMFKRGLATGNRIKVSDIAKNVPKKEPLGPLKPVEIVKSGSSMIKYIMETMNKYPQAVVITQVGSFYELYFQHALEYGPKLDLKIAQKRQFNPQNNQSWIPMTGFPVSQLARHTRSLVQDWGTNVVILSQEPDQILLKASEELKRPITRIVTPGTVIEEDFVDTFQQNFIVALFISPALVLARSPADTPVAIAWVDLADGSTFHQDTTLANVVDDLVRLNPREVILDSNFKKPEYYMHLKCLDLPRFYVSYFSFPQRESLPQFRHMIDSSEKTLRMTCDEMSEYSQAASAALLAYLGDALPGTQIKYMLPKLYTTGSSMQVDRISRDALELFKVGQRDSAEGSLFSTVRRTVTASGSRLLQQYMTSPTRDKQLINWRLDMVELLCKKSQFLGDLTGILHKTPDGKRTIQNLSMQKVNPDELLKWAATAKCIEAVSKLLGSLSCPLIEGCIKTLDDSLADILKVARAIERCIRNDKLDAQQDLATDGLGDLIEHRPYQLIVNTSASKKLKELDSRKHLLVEEYTTLQSKFVKKYAPWGETSLRYSPYQGYHCNVKFKGSNLPSLVGERLLSRSKNSINFTTVELTEFGGRYESCLQGLDFAQTKVLERLRQQALALTTVMRDSIEVLDLMDVLQGFASLALDENLCRPTIVDDPILDVLGGRNITVERGLQSEGMAFTSNDCQLIGEKKTTMVTGPNMGGKSTYIRQNGIICLLAQMGSFVPAEKATVGIVDRIFCRLGSGDDISRGRSTFLVEMMETSAILRLATEGSLAIVDEVGRGTSENDGVAIAYATIKHMIQVNKCRAMFATHYGPELFNALKRVDLDKRINFLMTDPPIDDKNVEYNHLLKPGICDDAHGLSMAKLAGFPADALELAHNVYLRL